MKLNNFNDMFVVCVSLLQIDCLRSVSVQMFVPTVRLRYICHAHLPCTRIKLVLHRFNTAELMIWDNNREKKSFKWKSSTSYIFFKVLPHPVINYSVNPSPTDNNANMHLHKLLNDVQIFGLRSWNTTCMVHENMRISKWISCDFLHRPSICMHCTWCQTHINRNHK